MSAAELIAQAAAFGIHLSVTAGKLVLSGTGKPSPEIVAALRAHKAEVMEHLGLLPARPELTSQATTVASDRPETITGRDEQKGSAMPAEPGVGGTATPGPVVSQRYGQPPDEEIPLAAYPPRLSPTRAALLPAHIQRQGRPVRDWVMRQANRYFEAFPQWSHQDWELSAALDAILWQRADRTKSTNRWDAANEVAELLAGLEEATCTLKEMKP